MGKTPQHSVGSLPCFMKSVSRMAITEEYPSYMTIPKEFKEQQMDKLCKDVTLKINAAKKWQMRIGPVKSDTVAFRGPGWAAFVRDNKLEIGDQIMFTMLSGSLFSVRITRAAECTSDAYKPVMQKVKQEPQSEEEGESNPPNKGGAQENRQSVKEPVAEAREAVVTNGGARKTAEKQKLGLVNGTVKRTVEKNARKDEGRTKAAEKTQEDAGRVKKPAAENVASPQAVTQQGQEDVARSKEITREKPTQQAQEGVVRPKETTREKPPEQAQDDAARAEVTQQATIKEPVVVQAQKNPPPGKKATKHTREVNGRREELVPAKQARVERQEEPLVEARTPARPPPLVTNNTDGNDSVTAERHVDKEVPQAHTPLTRARKRAAEQEVEVDRQVAENRNVQREVDYQQVENRNGDGVRERRRKKRRRGTAENPLVIDLSGSSKEAGIHLLLKTESDKKYKLFISASAVENIAVAQANSKAENPVTHSESELENGPTNSEHELEHAAIAESDSEPENIAPTNAAAQNPSSDKDTQADLPSITVPILRVHVTPYCRMTIEKAFATKWLPNQSCTINVVDSLGTEWPMKWVVGKKRMFSAGWSALVKHYNLRIGNRCTFKVVDPKTLKFSASDSSGEPIKAS